MSFAKSLSAACVVLVSTLLAGIAAADDEPPATKSAKPADPLAEARELTNHEEWDQALERFREFLKAHPDDPKASEARFWAGFCLVKLEEHEDAKAMLGPFETTLARDLWADDALLHLGKAHHGTGKESDALAIWKRHLEMYPESVWRTEVTLELIHLLFYDLHDLPACLGYCERLVKEVDDRETTGEARYLGAYCLNAQKRFDEAAKWEDAQFDAESPLEEAWRRVLGVQRDLIQGQTQPAFAALDSLNVDFPDLDHESRTDLLTRACYVLRFNGHTDRARELILAELRGASGRSEDEVSDLLGELSETFGDERWNDYLEALVTLAGHPETPLMVRVIARERRAEALVEEDHPARAVAALREVLADEKTEFARVRAAIQLAGILADDRDDRQGALKVLDDQIAKVSRRDLVHQLRSAAESYREAKE
jgi:tetratricopeptide (TPR) repeat protein